MLLHSSWATLSSTSYLKKKKKSFFPSWFLSIIYIYIYIIKYRSWANMLMRSLKMTIHLLLKKEKRKKTDDYSSATNLLHILNLLNCYPYNMSYYLQLWLFTSFHQNWNLEAKQFLCNVNAKLESSIQIILPHLIANPNLIYSAVSSLSPSFLFLFLFLIFKGYWRRIKVTFGVAWSSNLSR